ncbi:hypothetical protein GUJ93_ZPchr0003g16977 [Zizania palustris]|uniref:Secreted protein n=1 Tax=Zizania palustris TaxID=103762 RepID=A0A8J5VIL7_ZIZPA|nr:hypothetical protein GUJ93_ZPchr0003g16977 [Zizania palustris]
MPSDSVVIAAALWPVALTAAVESAARVPAVVAASELPAAGSPAAVISSVSALPAIPVKTTSVATAAGSSSSPSAARRSRPAGGRVLGLRAGHARPGQRASRSATNLHGSSSGPVAKELSADREVVRGRWNSGGATLTVGGWRGVGARGRLREADDGGSVRELGPVGEDKGAA